MSGTWEFTIYVTLKLSYMSLREVITYVISQSFCCLLIVQAMDGSVTSGTDGRDPQEQSRHPTSLMGEAGSGRVNDVTAVANAAHVMSAQQQQQQVGTGGPPIMVIQQQLPSGLGLVPATVAGGAQVAVSQGMVISASVPSSDQQGQQQVSGLYTTTQGIPAEYVIPGTSMLAQGGGGYVHVPVMSQGEPQADGKLYLCTISIATNVLDNCFGHPTMRSHMCSSGVLL